MRLPIKTIEQVSIKDTNSSAYLFIDASDNILKMKIKGKFYSVGTSGQGTDTPQDYDILIASGFAGYTFNSLLDAATLNGTWKRITTTDAETISKNGFGDEIWQHEENGYQLRLPPLSPDMTKRYWNVYFDSGESFEIWEVEGGSASPWEVKTWTSQLQFTSGKFEKKSSENGSDPETPNYGEGTLRVSGFTDLNDEMMGLSYPFSNFNGIYRKNSDTSYEKIYDLNNNPVSTPYFILMDTNNGYWCLCETSTISHYHNSIAYHDGDDGAMPPTAEKGITWFYSGQYDKTLRNFIIEVI